MDILVSFCNVSLPARPALALLDGGTFAVRVVQLPSEVPRRVSITGLAASEHFVYAALPGAPTGLSKLLVLDRADLRLLNYYYFRSVVDVHSLWVSDEGLYAVSTGTDEVIELRMRGAEVIAETVFWRPEPGGPREDVHHLNAVYGWRGNLLVSGFGKKAGEIWSLTRDGFVFNITRGEKIASSIPHPHSLVATDDMLAYCESGNMAVRVIGRAHVQRLPGYARGLCLVGQYLFVGTSIGRRVSKSTGMLNSPNATGALAGQCTISRLSLDRSEIEDTVDMTSYGDEIYDLLPIKDTSRWPVVSNVKFLSSEATWRHLLEVTTQELAALIPPGEAFILVDQEVLRKEIAAGRPAVPFLEGDGQYWGTPPDSIAAIQALERLRQSGAGFIVFAWPAFWWLDYYAELRKHLRSQFRCMLENDRLIAFDLRP
jgi:Domain of unknown function (DUF4915)